MCLDALLHDMFSLNRVKTTSGGEALRLCTRVVEWSVGGRREGGREGDSPQCKKGLLRRRKWPLAGGSAIGGAAFTPIVRKVDS